MKISRLFVLISFLIILFFSVCKAELSFYLIENFETNSFSDWFIFDNLNLSISKNVEKEDRISASCGEYSLLIEGETKDWYVGGIGTNLMVDASPFYFIQFDVDGSGAGGKLKIELYEDDNQNSEIEQDEKAKWAPTYDDKWSVEIPLLGPGYTRYIIPFTAFKDDNPKIGDDTFNPNRENGSGGLLRVQFIFISDEKEGKIKTKIDNILFTR